MMTVKAFFSHWRLGFPKIPSDSPVSGIDYKKIVTRIARGNVRLQLGKYKLEIDRSRLLDYSFVDHAK